MSNCTIKNFYLFLYSIKCFYIRNTEEKTLEKIIIELSKLLNHGLITIKSCKINDQILQLFRYVEMPYIFNSIFDIKEKIPKNYYYRINGDNIFINDFNEEIESRDNFDDIEMF